MRTSDLSPRAPGLFAAIALIALALSACGKSAAPIAPTAERVSASALRAELEGAAGLARNGQPANLFYPLDLGNHWGYEYTLSFYLIPEGGPPGPEVGLSERRNRDLVCVENRAGRSYVVERRSYPGGVFDWARYRQDGAGLYEADVVSSLPPDCAGVTGRQAFEADGVAPVPGEAVWARVEAKLADPAKQVAYRAAWERIQARASAVRQALGAAAGIPRAAAGGGVEPGEITRLEYPLHPGTRWVIRADPRFESIVEGTEVLDLAVGHVPGWRIRIESEFIGPDDRVHAWYGRSGFLKLAARFEDVATDNNGNLVGTLISEESEQLVELSLNQGRFATP